MEKFFLLLLKFILIFFSTVSLCLAQNEFTVDIDWLQTNILYHNEDTFRVLAFKDAFYDLNKDKFPIYKSKIQLPENIDTVIVDIDIIETITYSEDEKKLISSPISIDRLSWFISYERKVPYLIISYTPISDDFKVSKFSYSLKLIYSDYKLSSDYIYSNSVLSSGEWYKIKVNKDGLFKIDYYMLLQMGVDVLNIDPRKIQLFGNGGAMLPELNSTSRLDDLHENAIFIQGEQDGSFDEDDFIIFYGESPHRWRILGGIFNHIQNIYDDNNYYFLTISQNYGQRVSNQNIIEIESSEVDFYTDRKFHEWENINLKNTGRQWFGEYFSFSESYKINFNFNHRIKSEPVRINARAVGRSIIPTYMEFYHLENNILEFPIGTNVNGEIYVDDGMAHSEFLTNEDEIEINISYNQNGNSSAFAYLDFIEIQTKCELIFQGDQLIFSEPSTVYPGSITSFKLNSSISSFFVWDISRPDSIMSMTISNDNIFKSRTDILRTFVAHNIEQTNYFTPTFVSKVNNQNLHSHNPVDFVIITPPEFIEAANRLADLHIQKDQMTVKVVTTEQIYNEFSSGKQDLIALRSYLRMLYEKAETEDEILDNVLLFGDASYDYKGISIENSNQINQNLVPTFQSNYSFRLGSSYCTDDFISFLDISEGTQQNITINGIDLGVGRIVVQNLDQAHAMVDKIEKYTSVESIGPWRSNICFIADDIDDASWEYRLQDNIDGIAHEIDQSFHNYNINKIYLDAYQQISSSGGQRYPDAQKAIFEQVSNGALIVHYYGHGGEVGWAEERVLTLEDINSWNNSYRLPVFVTATCEFSRYDDTDRVSAGEQVLLNKDGGGIALFSTTRSITESAAEGLSRSFYDYAIPENTATKFTLGEILKEIKNGLIMGSSSSDKLKFALLGDPALKLPIPELQVIIKELEDSDSGQLISSIQALSKVKVRGVISDSEGNILNSFNGFLKPKVFDKPLVLQTLSNDFENLDPFYFTLQQSILYSGNVSISNGEFEFEFIVPKDISFTEGAGKFSLYAFDNNMDALGSFIDFTVGGINENAVDDQEGPKVDLFINSEQFMYGGITDANPSLYAVIFDESGINTTGNGIGHDIVATLDQDSQSSKVLNQFYEYDLDSYQSGVVIYPYSNLDQGIHELKIKVWDAYNNSSEAHTQFIVVNDASLILENLMSFPNPFSDYTKIYFEHNRANEILEVSLNIYDQLGRLIKTMNNTISSSSYSNSDFIWDGTSDFGQYVPSGIYYCNVIVNVPNSNEENILSHQMVLIR